MLDIIIVGAGPVGLYGAFYAGLRGLKGLLIESRDEIGGQASQFFKEKNVYDFPGQVETTGQGLIESLKKQYEEFSDLIPLKLNTSIQSLKKLEDGFEVSLNGETVLTKTILLAIGPGSPIPNKLNIPGENKFDVSYTVSNVNDFLNKKIVIFGGGDSAVDWANTFKEKSEVSIVHRRDTFRAKADAVEKLETGVNIFKSFECKEIKENTITIQNNNGENKDLEYDKILVQFGFKTSYGDIKDKWDLEFEKGRVKVDGWKRSNIKGIWAVGNACYYEGKINIITSGLGDVISALSSISTYINPKASPIFYSTNKK